MGGGTRVQRLQIKIRSVVYESSIFRGKREVSGQAVINAATVDECRSGLVARAGNESARFTRRIKHQGTCTGQNVRVELENAVGNCNNEGARSLVYVGLDRRRSSCLCFQVVGVETNSFLPDE